MNTLKKFRNLKSFLISILLICLVGLGCQPEGGEFVPVPADGIEIVTSRSEKDTALFNENGLKIKVYGDWNQNYVHLRIGFNNESDQIAKVKLERIVIKDGKGQVAKLTTISEKPDFNLIYDGKDKNLPALNLKINEKKSFNLEFAALVNFSGSDDSAKIIEVILPFESNGQIRELKTQLKAVGNKDSSGKSDPEDF